MKRDFSKNTLSVFLTYYRPHWRLLTVDMLCVLLSSLADLAFPLASRTAMRSLLPQALYRAFFAVMAILFGAYVIKAILRYVVTVVGHRCGVYMEADMRADLFEHLQSMSFSFFDRNRTGELMSRMTSDLFAVTEVAHHGPENILIALVTLTGAIIVLFTIRRELALVRGATRVDERQDRPVATRAGVAARGAVGVGDHMRKRCHVPSPTWPRPRWGHRRRRR